MRTRHAAPTISSVVLIALASLALLMTSSASMWGQSKKEAKKAPEKAANSKASDQETGLIISPNRKSATVKKGFVAMKVGDNQAIIRRASGITLAKASCSCGITIGSDQRPGNCKIEVEGNVIDCKQDTCTGDCLLVPLLTLK